MPIPSSLKPQSASLSGVVIAVFASLLIAPPVLAQEEKDEAKEHWRYRVALGPQIYPSYPGSDEFDVGPFIDVARARGDEEFPFEAPDESFGSALIDYAGVELGFVANFEGSRTASDAGADLPKVNNTIEAGAFVEISLGENLRFRSEARRGLGGHDGWITQSGLDLVVRDGDAWLFSIGPRVSWADDQYHDSWFSVAPVAAISSGLPAYDAGAGILSYGATAGVITQLSGSWGLYSYGKYDRLVGDAANSPITEQLGSRDQWTGGMALTYTFGHDVD